MRAREEHDQGSGGPTRGGRARAGGGPAIEERAHGGEDERARARAEERAEAALEAQLENVDLAPSTAGPGPSAVAHELQLASEETLPEELEGAPFVRAEAAADLIALKSRSRFVCTRLDGDILPGRASGEGFYAGDTRHLSELRLTIDGASPVLLSSAMESGQHALVNGTNPWLHDGRSGGTPQESLNVRRTILIDERLFYAVRVRSFEREPLAIRVALSLAADFADVFEVRGIERRTHGRVLGPQRDDSGLRFAYRAEDGVLRETRVELSPRPTYTVLDNERAALTWEIDLAPGEAALLEATFDARAPDVPRARAPVARRRAQDAGAHGATRPPLERAAARLQREVARWERSCARIETDNKLFDRVVKAAVRDLHALMMPARGGQIPAGGIPWYVAPFGRDSLVTALEALMLNPEIARGTLGVLATLQAQTDEAWRDAEPGKILHELRIGELARLGQIPHTPYYGTVDATPLFLMLAGHYYAWTGDLETLAQLRGALEAALAWIDDYGDADGDGFLEYERRSPAGLANQGWKDSEDAVLHPDGSPARGPIALVEVQGYVYEAKTMIAEVFAALGDESRAHALREQARTLRERFNESFWNARERYFALALDGRKRQVRTVTSNPAHCLYCGIVDEEKAAHVAERLMAPDMFSGWGVRTLSTSQRAYNPMSYHNGSVWPHDSAIAAAGLKRYGFDDAAERIAGALFDVAAGARDHRLPELLCGFARNGSRQLVAYPVACNPQAWATAAPFMFLQALLGISACAPEGTLMVNQPRLPEWLAGLDVRDLHVGKARVSLSFRRTSAGQTGFSLLGQDGDVRVTMSATAA